MRRYLLLLVVVLLVAAAGVAVAQTGGEINACAKNATGVLRVLGEGEECRANETAWTWNIQGHQGIPGPPGADGADGVSGYVMVTSCHPVAAGAWIASTPTCPAGKKVLGGGAHWSGYESCIGYSSLAVDVSHPQGETQWRASGTNSYTSGMWFKTYAICAAVD